MDVIDCIEIITFPLCVHRDSVLRFSFDCKMIERCYVGKRFFFFPESRNKLMTKKNEYRPFVCCCVYVCVCCARVCSYVYVLFLFGGIGKKGKYFLLMFVYLRCFFSTKIHEKKKKLHVYHFIPSGN